MTIGILFILGIANFALHRAMLDSDHPLLASLPPALRANGGASFSGVRIPHPLAGDAAGGEWVALGRVGLWRSIR